MKLAFITSILLILNFQVIAQPKSWINKKDTIAYFTKKSEKAPFSYNGKMGIIDSVGRVIVEAKYDYILQSFEENGFHYHMASLNKKDIVINTNGTIIIPAIFDDISPSTNGLFKVKKNGKYSFVDTTGKQMASWFDKTKFFRGGLAPVKIKSQWGFINTRGELQIPPQYTKVSVFSERGQAAVQINGKWGFINKQNELIIPCTYDRVRFFFNDLCAVKKNNKWGFINGKGEVVIPIIYKDALFFHCELAAVKIKGRYGYINISNEFVIPPIYLKAHTFGKKGQNAMVKKNLFKWIWINKKGECVSWCN